MKRLFIAFITLLMITPIYAREFSYSLSSEEDISGATVERRTMYIIDEMQKDPGNESSNLVFYEYKEGDDISTFFYIRYYDKEWRFYNGLLINIDGKVFTLNKTFDDNNVRSGGYVSEYCYIELSNDVLTALKKAKDIKVQLIASKYKHSVVTLPKEAINAINLFASRDFDKLKKDK